MPFPTGILASLRGTSFRHETRMTTLCHGDTTICVYAVQNLRGFPIDYSLNISFLFHWESKNRYRDSRLQGVLLSSIAIAISHNLASELVRIEIFVRTKPRGVPLDCSSNIYPLSHWDGRNFDCCFLCHASCSHRSQSQYSLQLPLRSMGSRPSPSMTPMVSLYITISRSHTLPGEI